MIAMGVLVLYFAALVGLALFGLHRWYLIAQYLRHCHHAPVAPARFDVPPRLTVQLPGLEILAAEGFFQHAYLDAVDDLDERLQRVVGVRVGSGMLTTLVSGLLMRCSSGFGGGVNLTILRT